MFSEYRQERRGSVPRSLFLHFHEAARLWLAAVVTLALVLAVAATAASGTSTRRRGPGVWLAAADLVVARAGAASLAEFPIFGLPAILVPYPYAWRYQKVNADYLAEQGAAIRMNDEDMQEQLWPTLADLLGDVDRLAEMSDNALGLAQPDAASWDNHC